MNNKKSGIIILIFLISLLFINPVNAFELDSEELEKSVCPSSIILLNANVFGTGSFNVNLEGTAAKWAVVVPQGFTLNNENKLVYIYVTPKFDSNSGFYNLNLIVTSGNEVKQLNYKINVPDCHNLVITGTESKEVCGCTQDSYNFIVSNNGIYQEAYKVEISGKAAPWVKLSQGEFALMPGQNKEIVAFLDAPCGSDFGENKFTITVRSLTSNAVASFDSNVIVNSWFDFNVRFDNEFVNMCEHSSEIIPITIENMADLDNEFDLSITGPAWASLHLTKLNLKAKESGMVNLVFLPDYKVEGNFDVNINVKSKESKISKDIKVKVNVRKCNDISLELLTRQDRICLGGKSVHEANIKNLGEFEKEFRIESSQGWININPVILTLPPGTSENIKLEFSPGENITAQRYDIKFRAVALDSSRVSSEDNFDLDLVSREQCYKPEVQVQDLEVNADSSATTSIIIKNVGAELAVYELGLSGNANSFSQLNPSTITIEPGKSEIVYLYVAPPYNTKGGNYKADITVSLKNAGVLDSKTINIKIGEGKTGLGTNVLNLWQRLLNFIKGFDLGATTELEPLIDISRENLISKNVKFAFGNETHSLKILEVTNNTVTVSIESDPILVLLDLNETEEVDLDNDGKTDLILSLKSFDKDGNPIIKVNKPREEPQKIDYFKNVKNKIYNYRYTLLIGLIVIVGLILFFGSGYHKKLVKFFEEEPEEGEPLKIGRWILLILILIVLFWYFRTYSDKLSLVLNFLNTYKFYIIAGLIILILLILIINYWKQIVDFFEEDAEEKPRRKKK